MSDPPGADAQQQAQRDQRERATGAWCLWIDGRPTDRAGWRTLRRTLRFSRADQAWLEDRIPGPVRRGARVDLEPLLESLRKAGIEASLRASRSPDPSGEAHGGGAGA